VLLALLGGLASLLVARWTLRDRLAAAARGGRDARARARAPVVLFAAVLAIGTGMLFGSTRRCTHAPDLISTLRAQRGQPSGARGAARFRTSLVTAQIALSMALLVAPGCSSRAW
jgi:putative ABC transport system permease protein